MNKSILVLDENSVIHGLITSALETEGLTLHHEFNPGRYVERANSVMPDLILIGNSERDPDYQICRHIRASGKLAEVPMVLLASSKEALTRDQLSHLRVDGVVRKPFEASDLQQQVSKHLDLVDLIGSAYEFRRSQSSLEDERNPLANLDVLDDEVLGMLRGTAPAPAVQAGRTARPARRPAAGAPVIDDEVLAETLQPELAFERVDEPRADAAAPRYDSLETLEGEFPSQTLELPDSEAQLEELGAADVLEEESAEEAVFEPQGFDQDFDAGRAGARSSESLDDIEVELPEEAVDLPAMDAELREGSVDLFEADLAPEPPLETAGDYEESIPLSVRRMMELKPVFTMTQEESAAQEDVLEPFDFEPDADEVQAIQRDLGELEEVELDEDSEEVQEQELEFASEQDLQAMEQELEPPEDFNLMSDEEAPEPPAAAAKAAPQAQAPPEPAAGPSLEEDELAAGEIDEGFAESLGEEEPPPRPAAAPRAEAEPVRAVGAETPEEDEDFFVDEYLGDEEIDEEQILAAEEEEPLEEAPELSPEDEAELHELLAEDEHLADLDELDELEEASLLADDAQDLGEDIELDSEEEDLIRTSLRAEHDAAAAVVKAPRGEPLFERNFNALEEEGAAEPEEQETWLLEQEGGGFTMADEEDEDAGIISLHHPEAEEELELEEMPASALEEVLEESAAAPAPEPAPEPGDEEPVSIEFGEGEGDVFGEEAREEAWKPSTPPSFVAQPAEDFPQDAVRDPFTGPQGGPREPEPPTAPRHVPEEVLEDPDSLSPVLAEEAQRAAAGEVGAADLADSVQPHELEEDDEFEAEELPEPHLTALADEALGSVQVQAAGPGEPWDAGMDDLEAEALEAEEAFDETMLDEELGEEPGSEDWEEQSEIPDAFEPVSLEPVSLEGGEPSADVTRGEMDALLDERGDAGGGELESILGTGHADVEPAQPAAAADTGNPEFDNLFASLQEEIAANPEGERLDDVLRKERIRDRAVSLELSLPQHENTFARAMGIYELPGDGGAPSAYPAALAGAGAAAAPRRTAVAAAQILAEPPRAAAAAPAAPAAAAAAAFGSAADVSALSLLDPDIRAKLGQVLDEIISISVRKAVQEEMPKIMERMSRDA
jgi:CheY-like chemotaxis protein